MENDSGPKIPQARSRLHQEAQPIEPNFDDAPEQEKIQKGMVARNFKSGLTMVALAVLLGFLFWPKSKPEVKVEPPPPVPVAPPANLVEELVRAKPQPEPETNKPVAIPGPPIGPQGSPQPLAAPMPSPEDERKMAALLSSTESSDVNLGKSNGARQGAPVDPIVSMLTAQQAKADKMLEDSQAFAQRMIQQGQPTAQVPVQANSSDQNSHSRFLAAQATAVGGLGAAVQLEAARTRNAIYEGTIVRTVLTRSLKTDLPGVITAKVTTDLYDTVTQRVLLIPRGSEITCNYQTDLMIGQELVLAACTRLRLPNGKSFSLNAATASDIQGASGLPAEINSHFWKMFKTAFIVGAASKLLPSDDQKVTETQGTTGVSTGGTILGTAMNKIIDQTLSRNISIPPTGTVAIGTPFTLTLSRDVELEPYLK